MTDHAAYMREWRKRRRALRASGAAVPHGTDDGYRNWGCRCDECRAAGSVNRQEWRAKDYEANKELRIATKRERDHASIHEAVNGRKAWTGAEMEIATARDSRGTYIHTRAEVAELLGRSLRAVEGIRFKCAHDPKYASLP